jgi:hypothetical protein
MHLSCGDCSPLHVGVAVRDALQSIILRFRELDPSRKASSLCARFCRGARFCQSRSLGLTSFVQLRASGVLRTACDRPLFPDQV